MRMVCIIVDLDVSNEATVQMATLQMHSSNIQLVHFQAR